MPRSSRLRFLPLSTAYAVCEGLGFESGVGKKFSEAPVFYWLYTILIVAGAGVILMPNIPLVKISILSQVVNGLVLPFVLVFMLLLVNNKEIMGEYVNSRLYNVVAWVTTVIMVGLTIAWFWTLRERIGLGSRTEFFLRPGLSPVADRLPENRRTATPSVSAQRMSLKIRFSISPLYSRTA